eukprot:GHVU01053686.1.p1 GENE.GHVU01053686.1~~GHVU01053686.1.p1  ORF type:complete len:101 (+),score=17.00 GHVU01053686.1:641-943(+)
MTMGVVTPNVAQQPNANVAASTNESPLSIPPNASVPGVEPPLLTMTAAANSEAESDAHMGEGADHMEGYESCGESGQASSSNLGVSAGEESGASKMEEED